MLRSLCLASLLCTASAFANGPIRVGIIDTGLDLSDSRFNGALCKYGHRDLTGAGIKDAQGHGTHIASIIKNQLDNKKSKYCLVIIKYYHTSQSNFKAFKQAVEYAGNLNLDIVNVSAGSPGYSEEEFLLFKRAKNTQFIVAAGNDGTDLDKGCYYYPACYNLPNIVTVGSKKPDGSRVPSSNYGSKVAAWEVGFEVEGYDIGSGTISYTGTSQATAVHTGKLVKRKIEEVK